MEPSVVGLFVGLTTLDTVYGVERPPSRDEKIVAREFFVGAGGPATNAAVTFAHLGGRATLLSAIGVGPLADFVRSDIEKFGVQHVELSLDGGVVPVSAVLVTSATGERAVISAHEAVPGPAAAAPATPANPATPATPANPATPAAPAAPAAGPERNDVRTPPDTGSDVLDGVHVVLLDGHRPEIAYDVVKHRLATKPPVVLDGGSWKDQTDKILPLADVVVCSASFRPPGTRSRQEALSFLLDAGPSFVAMTNGSQDIDWVSRDGRGRVTPPAVNVRDTLGAGDVFHGAFAWSIARQGLTPQRLSTQGCVVALELAARTAAKSVEYFGTRTWTDVESGRSRT